MSWGQYGPSGGYAGGGGGGGGEGQEPSFILHAMADAARHSLLRRGLAATIDWLEAAAAARSSKAKAKIKAKGGGRGKAKSSGKASKASEEEEEEAAAAGATWTLEELGAGHWAAARSTWIVARAEQVQVPVVVDGPSGKLRVTDPTEPQRPELPMSARELGLFLRQF